MTVRLLFDENPPPGLVPDLHGQFPESLHVRDIGLSAASDEEVWRRAAANGLVIVTKDDDGNRGVCRRSTRGAHGRATNAAVRRWSRVSKTAVAASVAIAIVAPTLTYIAAGLIAAHALPLLRFAFNGASPLFALAMTGVGASVSSGLWVLARRDTVAQLPAESDDSAQLRRV